LTELVNLADSTVVRSANAFCVALRDGRLPLEGDHPLGLYRDDCRHLRGYELRLGGRPARLLIASDAAGTGAVYELTNEEIALEDGRTLPLQSLRVRVERRMLNSAMTDRITLHSYAREPAEIDVDLNFDADFRPMLEVRGGVRPIRREVRREARGNALAFAATGRDGARSHAVDADARQDGGEDRKCADESAAEPLDAHGGAHALGHRQHFARWQLRRRWRSR